MLRNLHGDCKVEGAPDRYGFSQVMLDDGLAGYHKHRGVEAWVLDTQDVLAGGARLGVMLLRSGPARTLLVGLWGGYVLLGFAFAHHIHTHNYYSLQLIPVVALSLGALWDSVADYLARVDSST